MTEPRRVTVHPDLTPDQVKRLERALDLLRSPRTRRKETGCGTEIASFVTYWTGLLGMVVLLVLTLALVPVGFALPLFVVVLVGGVAATILVTSRVQSRPGRAARRTVDSLRGRFVTAAMLDESGR
ncbi:hypothetical protein, partial [Thermobifida halotolerans]